WRSVGSEARRRGEQSFRSAKFALFFGGSSGAFVVKGGTEIHSVLRVGKPAPNADDGVDAVRTSLLRVPCKKRNGPAKCPARFVCGAGSAPGKLYLSEQQSCDLAGGT